MPYIGNNHIAGDHTNNFKVLDDISSYTATFNGSASSVVDTTNNTIRVVEHRFIQGQRVTYTNGGGGNIGGLTTGTAYFIIHDSASTFKLATSASNAASSTAINLSAVGTGSSHTLNAAFDGVNTKFKLTHSSGTGARLNNATQVNVAINNVLQKPNQSVSYTEGFIIEDNHKIAFKTAPTSEDIFWGSIIANTLTTFDISDHKIDTFTGDGSTTEFTLSHTPANNESLIVTINGVLQHPSNASTARAYSLIASIIEFTAAPGVGDEIQVRHMGFAGATTSDVTGFYGRTGNVVLGSTDHITTGDITARNINASGILTASSASFGGNVSIGGTLTYEDVSNIDSVGIITARDGIDCNGDLDVDGHTNLDNVSIAGITTFSGIVDAVNTPASIRVAQDIQHKGDADTKISFPADNTISFDTAGSTRFGLSSSGNIELHGTQTGNNVATIYNGTGFLGFYASSNSGVNRDFRFFSSNSNSNESLRISSNGNVNVYKDLDVDGHTNLDNVSIAGITTMGQTTIFTTGGTTLLLKDSDSSNPADRSGIAFVDQNNTQTAFIGKESASDAVLTINNTNTINPIRLKVNNTTRLEVGNAGVYATGSLSATGTLSAGGTLYIPDDIQHSGDADTKIRFPAADTISFETAGTERLRFESWGGIHNNQTAIYGGGVANEPTVHFNGSGPSNDLERGHLAVSHNAAYNASPIARIALTTRYNSSGGYTFMGGIEGGKANTTDNNFDGFVRLVVRKHGQGNIEGLRITSGGILCTGNYSTVLDPTAGSIQINGDTSGGRLSFRGTTTSAYGGLGEIHGFWDTNKVASILFHAGADTSNKDDGEIRMYTRPSGGSAAERLRITSAGFVQIGSGANGAEAPLHVTAENSQGINAIFGAKDFVVHNNYNYDDANIALQGRDADDNDTGAGIQFTVRNTANTNWLHGAITMDRSNNYIFKNGGAGTTVGTERLRITSGGQIGINQTDIDADLHIATAGSSEQDGTLKIGGSENSLGLVLAYDQAGYTVSTITANPTYQSSGTLLKIRANGGDNPDQLVLSGGGKIGINIADNTAADLQVRTGTNGAGLLRVGGSNGNGVGMDINYSNSGATSTIFKQNYLATNAGALMQFDSGYFRFRVGTSPTEVLRIRSDGKVLMGSGLPSSGYTNSHLHVEGPGVDLRSDYDTDDNQGLSPHLTLVGSNAHVRLDMGTQDVGPYACWIQARYDNDPEDTGTSNSGIEPLMLNPMGGPIGMNINTDASYGSGNWTGNTSPYGGLLMRAGRANSATVNNYSTAIKIYPAETRTTTVGEQNQGVKFGGIAWHGLDPHHNNGSWASSYQGHQCWMGMSYHSTPGQELSNWQVQMNNNSAPGSFATKVAIQANPQGYITHPNQPYASTTLANASAGQMIPHATVYANNGGHFNTSNSRFICPVNGFYLVSIMCMSNNSNTTMDIELRKNGSNANNILVPYQASTGGQYNQVSGTTIIECAKNDYLQFRVGNGSIYSGRHSAQCFALLG